MALFWEVLSLTMHSHNIFNLVTKLNHFLGLYTHIESHASQMGCWANADLLERSLLI